MKDTQGDPKRLYMSVREGGRGEEEGGEGCEQERCHTHTERESETERVRERERERDGGERGGGGGRHMGRKMEQESGEE